MTGLIVRKTGDTISLDEYLVDTNNAIIETGTTTLWLFYLDGTTMKYYDWGTDTFVTTGGTTSTTMTYKDVNSLGTGIWQKTIATLTGFTSGARYYYKVNSNDANWGADVLGSFIYGGGDGDWTATNIGYVDASISSRSDFDETSNQVIVATNNDKTGYTVSTVTDKTGYSISGTKTTLDALNDIDGSAVTVASASEDSIVDKVWDEPQSGHTTADTFGKHLDTEVSGVGGASAADIADAVWDEAISGHQTSGTFGEFLTIIAGLGGKNQTIHPTYVGNKLTSANIYIFATKAQADANRADESVTTGLVDQFTLTQTWTGNFVTAFSETDSS